MNRLTEVILYPFAKGDLTTTGVQYSTLLTTSTDVYETVESVKVDIPVDRGRKSEPLVELEFRLDCALQSSGATESVLFKWQYSLDNSTWEDIVPEVTCAASMAALTEYSYSGLFPVTGLTSVPFWVRLQIKSGGAGGETAKGKTKNSSFVRVVYSNN
jgi:hypothetical protein